MKAKTDKPQILNWEMILKARMETNLIFIKQITEGSAYERWLTLTVKSGIVRKAEEKW